MQSLQGKLLIAIKIEAIKNNKSYSLSFQWLRFSFGASNKVTLGFERRKKKGKVDGLEESVWEEEWIWKTWALESGQPGLAAKPCQLWAVWICTGSITSVKFSFCDLHTGV